MKNTLRFSLGTTLGGLEVVDQDGRPVTPTYATEQLAVAMRDELNAAAARGRKALAKALGAVEVAA